MAGKAAVENASTASPTRWWALSAIPRCRFPLPGRRAARVALAVFGGLSVPPGADSFRSCGKNRKKGTPKGRAFYKAALPFGIPSSEIWIDARLTHYRARSRPPAVPRNRTGSGMSVCVFGGASHDPYAPATLFAPVGNGLDLRDIPARRFVPRSVGADSIRPRIPSSLVPVGAGLDPPAVTPSFFAERSRPFPTGQCEIPRVPTGGYYPPLWCGVLVGRGLAPAAISRTQITIARHGRRPGSRTVICKANAARRFRRMGFQREGRLCKKPFPLACLSSDSFRTSGKNRPPEGRTSRRIPPGHPGRPAAPARKTTPAKNPAERSRPFPTPPGTPRPAARPAP
jgi:hypothetical protein